MIKTLADNKNFLNAVTVLFQAVVITCCSPNPWKRAIVTALHRKVPLNDACNYRPISLTCILCKVFEKLLYRHLYTHVRDNLSPHQHGFVQGKSCLSNLLETVHEINTILEDVEVVDLVYLDFQKAFVKVPHERLALKLKAHGMTGQCNNIIRNFITGRRMAVRVGDELGNLSTRRSWYHGRQPEVLRDGLQNVSPEVQILVSSKIIFFIQKYKFFVWNHIFFVAKKQNLTQIFERHVQLNYSVGVRDVFTLFCLMICTWHAKRGKRSGSGCFSWWYPCWKEQIRGMIGKAKQMTSWIITKVVYRKPEVLVPFYKAFVRPHLEYAVQVWAPTARHGNCGIIMEIEDCQRQFTRIIEGMGPLSFRRRL